VQIFKACQKSEIQIKFKKVSFLELGPAQDFIPVAWALAFSRPISPSSPRPASPSTGPAGHPLPHSSWALASRPARPSPPPSLSLTNARTPPFVFLLRPLGHYAAATGSRARSHLFTILSSPRNGHRLPPFKSHPWLPVPLPKWLPIAINGAGRAPSTQPPPLPPLASTKGRGAPPGHHHTHPGPSLLAPKSATRTSPSTDRRRHFPQSPGQLTVARPLVRPLTGSPTLTPHPPPLPRRPLVPEWPEAELR
jgi:hypothetical protein